MTNKVSDNTTYTLAEGVDRYLVRVGIERKKYFGRYLILAEECIQDIFQNSLWMIKSVWMTTKAGTPYNYVNLPSDCQRLLSVGIEDRCGLIQPLFYNNQINVVAKPTSKKCGCKCGTCGGLCDSVASTIKTSELMFTISGVPYYRICWIKYCPNGDIIKFCRTPVKKYNNVLGDPGDYSPEDYMNDWLIGNPPFSDYTIVYLEEQEKICHLEVLPCGCAAETEENTNLFWDCCNMWVDTTCWNKKKYCRQYSENINNNHFGDVKISDCGNKIYYRPTREWKSYQTKEIPDFLLVNYQSTGTSCGAETVFPKFAAKLLYAMLDNGRKEYNSSFSLREKEEAHYKVVKEKCDIVGYLNPIDLIFMAGVQDAPIRY